MKLRFLAIGRVIALMIPMLIVLFANEGLSETARQDFFLLLTESMLIMMVVKCGADTIFPSLRVRDDGSLELPKGYLILSVVMIFVSVLSIAVLGLSCSILLIALASAAILWCGEYLRLIGYDIVIYFSKAPPVYVFAIAFSLYFSAGLVLSVVVLAAGMIFLGCKSKKTEESEVLLYLNGFIGSSLIVFYSWRESFYVRVFGSPEELADVVFYTRMKLILLFVAVIYSNRAVQVARGILKSDNPSGNDFVSASRAGILQSAGFLVLVGSGLCLYEFYFRDGTSLGLVFSVILGSLLQVFSGFVVPIFSVISKPSALIIVNLVASFVFFVFSAFCQFYLGTSVIDSVSIGLVAGGFGYFFASMHVTSDIRRTM